MPLTSAGLEIKRLAEIRADLVSGFKTAFGISDEVAADPSSVTNKLAGVLALPLSLVWQGVQDVFDSFNPETATGLALDNLCSITGVFRERATFATATLTIVGTPGAIIPAGKLARSSTTGAVFRLNATTTIPGGGAIEAAFRANEPGAVSELAGDIDEILTPAAGWSSVTNAADVTGGTDAETDEALRDRRRLSLGIVGSSTDAAIAAEVVALASVQQARCFSNRTLATVNDRPAKSFEVVVWPASGTTPLLEAEAVEVATTIFSKMPAGVQSFGSEVFDVADSGDYVTEVGFSYADTVDIFFEVDVIVDADYVGDSAVAAALVAAFVPQIGGDVFTVDGVCALTSLAGVRSVDIRVGDALLPTEEVRFAIGETEIPLFSTSRVVVAATPL